MLITTSIENREPLGRNFIFTEGLNLIPLFIEDGQAYILSIFTEEVIDYYTHRVRIASINELAFFLSIDNPLLIESMTGTSILNKVVFFIRWGTTTIVHPPVVAKASIGFGFKQVSCLVRKFWSILPYRAYIIENPEASTVSCDRQICILNFKIVNWYTRQIKI